MKIQRIVRTGPGPDDVALETIPPEEYYIEDDGARVLVFMRNQDGWALKGEWRSV